MDNGKKIKPSEIRLIQMNKYIRPDVTEVSNKDWVLNGRDNSFYRYIIARGTGSPTNAAIINSYVNLIYGKGLVQTRGTVQDWLKFKKMLSNEELKKVIYDFELFGEASMQIVKANNPKKLPTIFQIPKQNTLPKKVNEKREITGYFFADDWQKVTSEEDVDFYKVLGSEEKGKSKKTEVFVIRPYSAGKIYFSDPDYIAGLPYAELEEEIANYYLSHIKNGLSFGYIVNIPDGNSYNAEEKDELERLIKLRLVGSQNAGKFIINFNGGDAQITVTALEVNDAHKQWEFLVGEARQQLMTAHKVTSPMLFGIKDSTGLGNNADELDTAEAQLMKRVIQPKQQFIIDALEDILHFYDLNVKLEFQPLTDPTTIPALNNAKGVTVSFNAQEKINRMLETTANALLDMGEDVDDVEWELVEERVVDSHTLSEDTLLGVLEFATVVKSSPAKKSEQDTSLFKIRYQYAGNPNPEREFCRKMMFAGKTYRIEDIEAAENQTVNAGFGPNGTDQYSILKYKGGVNCKHFWERRIFLKRNNKKISVNQARRLILKLDPKDRPSAKWQKNTKEVAVIASPSNNHWMKN